MFSKGRSFPAAFSGVRDTGIYLFYHGELGEAGMVFVDCAERWWWQVGKIPKYPGIVSCCLCLSLKIFFPLRYIIIKWLSNDSLPEWNTSRNLRIIKVPALCTELWRGKRRLFCNFQGNKEGFQCLSSPVLGVCEDIYWKQQTGARGMTTCLQAWRSVLTVY